MKFSRSALAAAGLLSVLPVQALSAGDADQVYSDWSNAFLFRDGDLAWYDLYINSTTRDKGWTLARDIFVSEDVFFRRGDPDSQNDVRALASYWLGKNPTSGWSGDCWNDDIDWYTLMLVRAYQTTGNESYIEPAKYGNDLVFNRGWNTTDDDGGIWEKQPSCDDNPQKQALSTVPAGMTSCLIYQATHNETYLDRCSTIYNWLRTHLYNTTTGVLDEGIYPSGKLDESHPITDIGRFIELANFIWMATGNEKYYSDAKLATEYGLHNSSTQKDGIFSTTQLDSYDAFGPLARGAGNFIRDNNLWDTYYAQFLNSSEYILKNRDEKYNITWNNWLEKTPDTPTTQDSAGNASVIVYDSAVTWLQYTPPFNPSNITLGIRTISNVQTKQFLTSTGSYSLPQPVGLQALTNGSTQTQRWQLTTNEYNSNSSYNLVNLHSWLTLTSPNSSTSTVVQDFPLRHQEQRWYVNSLGSNMYSITNKVTGLALDAGTSTKNESTVTLSKYTGADSQKWHIDALPAPKNA